MKHLNFFHPRVPPFWKKIGDKISRVDHIIPRKFGEGEHLTKTLEEFEDIRTKIQTERQADRERDSKCLLLLQSYAAKHLYHIKVAHV